MTRASQVFQSKSQVMLIGVLNHFVPTQDTAALPKEKRSNISTCLIMMLLTNKLCLV